MSAKDSSISITLFSSSLILFLTSFIIHPGVDAPAVIPTEATPLTILRSSSSARLMWRTSGQCARHNSARRFVLELFRSPITIIAPQCSARRCASDCRLHVASHIVSKISAFVHSFFTFSLQGVQILSVDVVWETKVSGFCEFSLSSSRKIDNSSSFRKTFAPWHHPAMAFTSGCSGAPMMTTCRPRSLASFTI